MSTRERRLTYETLPQPLVLPGQELSHAESGATGSVAWEVQSMSKDIKDSPLLLTVPQAAELLQLGQDAVYNLCHMDGFPAMRIGRSVRINRAGLQDWLDRNNGGMIL